MKFLQKKLRTTVTYEIKDNGVGFNDRYKDKLFEVFQRLHKMDEFEGSGVGLAIVKRIINRHGGDVSAEGQEGVGSVFRFTLACEDPVGDLRFTIYDLRLPAERRCPPLRLRVAFGEARLAGAGDGIFRNFLQYCMPLLAIIPR